MFRYNALMATAFILTVSAAAQPAISSYQPIANSASYLSPGMSASGIAQGSVFAVFGSGFGPSGSYTTAATYPLQTTLGGVSVKVTVSGTSVNAIMLGVFYGYQINALLPSSTPVGSGTFTVSFAGHTSAQAPIQVVATAFGLYAANWQADGQASATNASGNPNSIINTFHPGDTVTLWGTGLGPVSWDETQLPSAGDLSSSLPVATQVYIGNTTVAAGYHGRAGCCSGVDQVVFTIPSGVQGCYVPVAVQAGGVTSNIVTIAVSNSGSTCSDSPMGQNLVNKLAAGGPVNFGYIRLEAGSYNSYDGGYATFNQFTPATATLASYAPSVGYCMAVDCSVRCQTNGNESLTDLTEPIYNGLDAGSGIGVQGEAGNAVIQQQYLGLYGNYNLGNGSRFLFASPPPFTVSDITGGLNVGPFSASVSVSGSASAFSNIPRYETVPRNSDLTVKWNTGSFKNPGGLATIAGYSESEGFQNIALFQCTANASDGQFTIPAWLLTWLPVTGLNGNANGTGALLLGQYDPPVQFNATGLDLGLITDITFYWVGVSFK